MRWIEAEHQAIEKPPPAARTVEKEPVHRRRQPYQAQPLAERRLAANRLSVDAHDTALACRAISPGPDPQRAAARCDDCGDRPPRIRRLASGLGSPIDLGQFGTAQPAARREKG